MVVVVDMVIVVVIDVVDVVVVLCYDLVMWKIFLSVLVEKWLIWELLLCFTALQSDSKMGITLSFLRIYC